MNSSGLGESVHTLRVRALDDDGGAVRLTLHGELDREEVGGFSDAIRATVREHPGRAITCDARGLRFLDAAGIRALLVCHEWAGAAGCRFTITT
ncbi:STAS domain-containing protein [Actinoplanes oblitus]|uniref:STAS domain-containing protein n=1 Tax=Actinoplanes oblitus TaxID=3040509 RepID=A0ABY8W8F6_9ACTN|nr:STAS domain-containing protein [Actinoplanes oblitus]WIM93333.1 STAS domain-containing protein [Actinoplanes oblitus]